MKEFLNEDFLLESEVARVLYHDYVADLPIIDYHNHLTPKDIANDKVFSNLTEAWLEGDHYKWRAMRANGVDEVFCTGEALPRDKFIKWSETVPYTMRNPLYHWTHLELQRYFGITELLNGETADYIYENANAQLESLSIGQMLSKMKVEVVSTTDDPIDTLEHHMAWNEMGESMILVPTFRADKVLLVKDVPQWNYYVDRLELQANQPIRSFDELMGALQARHDFFDELGCRLSDNGLDRIYAEDYSATDIEAIFNSLRRGRAVTGYESDQLRSALLHELAKMHHAKGWTQQYHLGALRNNSSRMMRRLGPDTGFDSMGDFQQAEGLGRFLDRLDSTDQLAKTVIYNLNPVQNEVFATMAGNFNDGSIAGKMQFGTGWWFMDQKDGMERQMNALSNMGLISRFVGMLTDSRSFMSFPRHEYFRRILCNIFGKDIENGELPHDVKWIGKLVQDISYYNAKDFFKFSHVSRPFPIQE